jgi:hypothetical protein
VAKQRFSRSPQSGPSSNAVCANSWNKRCPASVLSVGCDRSGTLGSWPSTVGPLQAGPDRAATGAFGEVDDLEVTLTGRFKGGVTASCKGTAKQAPGLTLEATLVHMTDDQEINAQNSL